MGGSEGEIYEYVLLNVIGVYLTLCCLSDVQMLYAPKKRRILSPLNFVAYARSAVFAFPPELTMQRLWWPKKVCCVERCELGFSSVELSAWK